MEQGILRYDGSRLLVDNELKLQLFVIKRDQIFEGLRDSAPTGYRIGCNIKAMKKKDPQANEQIVLAEIQGSFHPDESSLKSFVEEAKAMADMAAEIETIKIYYPHIDEYSLWIIID